MSLLPQINISPTLYSTRTTSADIVCTIRTMSISYTKLTKHDLFRKIQSYIYTVHQVNIYQEHMNVSVQYVMGSSGARGLILMFSVIWYRVKLIHSAWALQIFFSISGRLLLWPRFQKNKHITKNKCLTFLIFQDVYDTIFI